jgi:uncharacterized membrane protein
MGRENVLRHFEEKRFRFYASEIDIPISIACFFVAFWIADVFFSDVDSWKQYLVVALVYAESMRVALWLRKRFFGKYFNENS